MSVRVLCCSCCVHCHSLFSSRMVDWRCASAFSCSCSVSSVIFLIALLSFFHGNLPWGLFRFFLLLSFLPSSIRPPIFHVSPFSRLVNLFAFRVFLFPPSFHAFHFAMFFSLLAIVFCSEGAEETGKEEPYMGLLISGAVMGMDCCIYLYSLTGENRYIDR